MLHGLRAVQAIPACGKAPLPPAGAFQMTAVPGKVVVPSTFVPPKVCPVGQLPPIGIGTLQAPAGTAMRGFDVKFWAPSCEPNWPVTNVVYMILDPPRITVVPLPVTS